MAGVTVYPNTVANLPSWWAVLYAPPMTLSNDGTYWTAVMTFVTTWDNLVSFVLQIAGDNTIVNVGATRTINRVCTLQHPDYTGLYASTVASEGFGEYDLTTPWPTVWNGTNYTNYPIGFPGTVMYSHVKVTITFTTYRFPTIGDDAFMSWDSDRGTEYATVSGWRFAFPSGDPIDQDAGIMKNKNTYTLNIFNAPAMNDDVYDSLAGGVNNADFKINLTNRPAGTVFFAGCKSNQSTSIGGVQKFTKQLVFIYSSLPWNQLIQRDGTAGTPVDPASNTMYQEVDFSGLYV